MGTALGSPHQIPELQVFGAFLYVTQVPDAVGAHFIQALNGNGGALVSALNAHGAVLRCWDTCNAHSGSNT